MCIAENFPDPTLVERLKIMAGDPQTDPVVKKMLMSTLKGFHASYASDRSMRIYADWWDQVGGARGVRNVRNDTLCVADPIAVQESDARAKEAYQKEQVRLDKEQQMRLDEKMARRLQGEEDEDAKKRREMAAQRKAERIRKEQAEANMKKAREEEEARQAEKERAKAEKKSSANSFFSSAGGVGIGGSGSSGGAIRPGGTTGAKRAPFNFEKEKPNIQAAVASASMYSNGLVNSLQHVNREKESVASNVAVQGQLNKLKDSRKQVVRYIQLCEMDKDGEYIGMLISSK